MYSYFFNHHINFFIKYNYLHVLNKIYKTCVKHNCIITKTQNCILINIETDNKELINELIDIIKN